MYWIHHCICSQSVKKLLLRYLTGFYMLNFFFSQKASCYIKNLRKLWLRLYRGQRALSCHSPSPIPFWSITFSSSWVTHSSLVWVFSKANERNVPFFFHRENKLCHVQVKYIFLKTMIWFYSEIDYCQQYQVDLNSSN